MPCQHESCPDPVVAEGRCETHYREWLARVEKLLREEYPAPWRRAHYGISGIRDAGGKAIYAQHHRDLIIHAVNSHAALVEKVRVLREAASNLPGGAPHELIVGLANSEHRGAWSRLT